MNLKKILKVVIPLILGVFLVWYSFTIISLDELLELFKKANYWWIALGLFFGVLSHLSRAYRWKFLLEPLGYSPRFANSTLAVLTAYLINLFLPRAGEVTRAAVMTNYEKIPFEKGLGTIVAERIADLIMMLLIIFVALFIQFDFIFDLLKSKFENYNPFKIGLLLGTVFLVVFVFIRYLKKAKSGLGFKIKNFIASLSEGIASILKMKNKWAFIFHTVFIWAMYIAMFWATIPAIAGLEVPFGGVLVGFIAGGFAVAATNGGFGAYPIAVGAALSLFGINEEIGTGFGTVMWAAQTAMIIVFGGLAFLILPMYNKNASKKEQ